MNEYVNFEIQKANFMLEQIVNSVEIGVPTYELTQSDINALFLVVAVPVISAAAIIGVEAIRGAFIHLTTTEWWKA